MNIFGRPVKLGDPQRADVVIFDRVGSQYVLKAINPRHSVEIFDARPAPIRIGPRTLGEFIRGVASFDPAAVDQSRGVARGTAKVLWLLYLQAMLAAMRPKAVVTFIDNSGDFHWLSRNCRRFPMIAIQNGTRLRSAAADSGVYHLQHLFSHGLHEARVFPEFGYTVESYHPAGSLIAGLHFGPAQDPQYDLLVVSTWRGNIGYQKDVEDMMRGMRIMDELLAAYIRSRNIRAAVILRAERDSEHWTMPEMKGTEEEYFKSVYGGVIEIIETDFAKRNIFPLMRQSRLIVSCLSSALLEAFGIGRKILYCNFTGTDEYHADLDPSILATDPDRDAFFTRLDDLLAIPESDYLRGTAWLRNYYMSDPDLPPHLAIAAGIDGIIAGFRQATSG